jgi:predicted amidophosphoribosyltransferase
MPPNCRYCGTPLTFDEERLCEECELEARDLGLSEDEMINGPKTEEDE